MFNENNINYFIFHIDIFEVFCSKRKIDKKIFFVQINILPLVVCFQYKYKFSILFFGFCLCSVQCAQTLSTVNLLEIEIIFIEIYRKSRRKKN